MRVGSLVVLLLVGSLGVSQGQQGEPPKKARIEGTVLSLTGEPVPRAQLQLVGGVTIAAPAGAGAAKSGGPAVTTAPSSVSATSDDAGKFVIENIEPGRNYQLRAQRPGFVPARYGSRSATAPGSPLTLDTGAELKNLVITMTPQGVISGKVTDQAGDPVQSALVVVLRRGYQRGVRQLVLMNTFSTNDQGEYRLANLAPGKYYVVATDRIYLGVGATNTGSGRLGNVPTYYPTATDPQAAIAVDVTPGAELRGIDIRFRQARMYVIRGKVDASGAAGANISLQALPKEASNQLNESTAAPRPPDYTFELRNMIPGAYLIVPRLLATVNGTPSIRMGSPVEIIVADADINGLTIPVTAGVPVTGTVAFEGGDVKTLATASGQAAELVAAVAAGATLNIPAVRPTVALLPLWSTVPTTAASSSQITESGAIRIEGVAPGKYQLSMNGLPAGAYIKSARFGGEDALRGPIDLSSGGSGELTIVLSNQAADLTGAVRDDKIQSLGGLMVTVWSKEPESGNYTNGVRTTYTDQTGGFEFKGLPPGDYLAAAWEDADAQLVLSRDFLLEFASEAATVTLAEGGRGAIEAKLVTADKIKAAEAKLP